MNNYPPNSVQEYLDAAGDAIELLNSYPTYSTRERVITNTLEVLRLAVVKLKQEVQQVSPIPSQIGKGE
jgi:hypothetical protein